MEKEPTNIKKRSSRFLKYTTLASQMLFPILLGVFLGKYIDEKFNGGGLYLALIALLSVVISIYLGIKDLLKSNKL